MTSASRRRTAPPATQSPAALEQEARADPAAAAAAITNLLTPGAAIHRCVGTARDVADYRLSRLPEGDPRRDGWVAPEYSWNVLGGKPGPGDLLLGVTRPDSATYTIDLAPVLGVRDASPARNVRGSGRGSAPGRGRRPARVYPWLVETDVDADLPLPLLDLERVHAAMTSRPRPGWRVLRGEAAVAFVQALAAVASQPPAPSRRAEGEASTARCRQRNRANRAEVIEAANGVCQGCRLDVRGWFGDTVLDAHHVIPLAQRPPGAVLTGTDELVALCPTCHRAVHAHPHWSEPIVMLRLLWDRIHTAGQP